MLKKITVVGLLCTVLTAQANAFSKNDGEIIALANKYESQTLQPAGKQTNNNCYTYLSTASEMLGYIPLMIDDRATAKQTAQYASDYIHSSSLMNCQNKIDINSLDNEVKSFILDF